MKTIKKTTLIAAITAMAAFAVPSMASAAVWGPLNANKTLTSTNSAKYIAQGYPQYGFECANSTLGVHVRTPASSTLDITSASFTGCVLTSPDPCIATVSVTATGLPWTATTSGLNVAVNEHLQATYVGGCAPGTLNIDGPTVGGFYNATHILTGSPMSGLLTGGMRAYYMGSYVFPIGGGAPSTQWHDATNTLTLT
jgi:hypothetical protein